MKPHQMLFKRFTKDYDIVKVNQTCLSIQPCQDSFHHALKSRWGICKPKGHNPELIKAIGHGKGGLLHILGIHRDLTVPTGKV